MDKGRILSIGSKLLRELGKSSLKSSNLFSIGSREHLELSKSLESSVRNESNLFNLEIGILDEVGHGESLLKNGVQHESMVISPAASQSGEFSDGVVGVLLERVLQISVDVEGLSSIDLREEDKESILIKTELDVGVLGGNSLEFNNKFLNQEGLRELVGNGDGVSGGNNDGSWDFLLDNSVVVDSDNSLNSSKSVEFSEVFLDDDDDTDEVWLSSFEFSQFS